MGSVLESSRVSKRWFDGNQSRILRSREDLKTVISTENPLSRNENPDFFNLAQKGKSGGEE